jgi:hypothetical protein
MTAQNHDHAALQQLVHLVGISSSLSSSPHARHMGSKEMAADSFG